jgi:hypothetical protein
MARQSSWFTLGDVSWSLEEEEEAYMLAPEIVTPVEDPTSKASVLCPREAPLALFMVRPEMVRVVAALMDINWTGESLKVRPEIVDLVRE